MSLNAFPAWCEFCSAVKPAGHGSLVRSRRGRAQWIVRCNGVSRRAQEQAPVASAALVTAPASRLPEGLPAVAAEAAERVRAAQAAAAATAERQRTAGWMASFQADPTIAREREAAVAARRELARQIAERNRALSPALHRAEPKVTPQIGADGSVRGAGLELDEIQVEPEIAQPVARWSGLELD